MTKYIDVKCTTCSDTCCIHFLVCGEKKNVSYPKIAFNSDFLIIFLTSQCIKIMG